MPLLCGLHTSVLTGVSPSDPVSRWVLALRERSGWQKAAVALADKSARILWAVMTRGDKFDAHHVSLESSQAAAAAGKLD